MTVTIEKSYNYYYSNNATANSGESFFTEGNFDEYGHWMDLTNIWETANFCIKGFTKTGEANPPTVRFTPNSNETYKEEQSTIVNVSDETEINASSLKYVWTQSETQPQEDEFINSFSNNSEITIDRGEGEYYLWIYAEDIFGNKSITRSDAFKVDSDNIYIRPRPKLVRM